MSIKTFEDLHCYQAARELRKKISKLCKSLPKVEEYRLKDQFIRSSRSVTSMIAEGYGRHHHQENLQYARMSRGSLAECLDHLNVALDEEYIEKGYYNNLRKELESVWRLVNGYIGYLKKCVQNGVPNE